MKSYLGNILFKRYIISFLAAFLTTTVLCGISAVLFSFFAPPDWLQNSFVHYSCYFSAFLAAIFSAMGSRKNGLVTGVICADIYMLILIFAGMIFLKNDFPLKSLLKVFSICSLSGGLGGIIGINFKK